VSDRVDDRREIVACTRLGLFHRGTFPRAPVRPNCRVFSRSRSRLAARSRGFSAVADAARPSRDEASALRGTRPDNANDRCGCVSAGMRARASYPACFESLSQTRCALVSPSLNVLEVPRNTLQRVSLLRADFGPPSVRSSRRRAGRLQPGTPDEMPTSGGHTGRGGTGSESDPPP